MHVILAEFTINMPEMCQKWSRNTVCIHCGSHIVLKITNEIRTEYNQMIRCGSKIWIKQLGRKITSKLYFVEAALILEITPCPLTDKNRDSKNNFRHKWFAKY